MNYRTILYTLGWVLNIEAACLLLPAICAVCYGEIFYLKYIAISIGLCLLFGIALTFRAPENKAMYAKEGFVTVAFSWIVMSIFGCLPFYLSGVIPNIVNAFFETVSGFTTTGATILTDVEALPNCLLFWRSFTHWIGGMGVLVFLVALLPLSGGGNFHLMRAESTGPAVSKIVPKVKSSAKIIYLIYIAMTVIEIVLLLFGGLDLFSALTLSFGTAGTGGFGILNSSIADYSSYVQVVISIFMLLFGVDFSLYYLALIGKIKDAVKSEEFRSYFAIVAVAVTAVTVNIVGMFEGVWEALKHSLFQVASIMTTTGYTTTDFNMWPEFSKAVLVALMMIGACAGSTGGGIKVSRILILLKSIIKEIRVAAHPKTTMKINLNGRPVEHETVRAVNVYMGTFLTIVVTSVLLVSIDNFGFTTNVTAVLATVNNVGPGLELVGPTGNFAMFSGLSKIIFSGLMLIGRLEIFPMLMLFSYRTWKK